MQTKKWYQSWTVWFNVAMLAIDVTNQLAQIVPIPAGTVTALATVGNILLRLKTFQAIQTTPTSGDEGVI